MGLFEKYREEPAPTALLVKYQEEEEPSWFSRALEVRLKEKVPLVEAVKGLLPKREAEPIPNLPIGFQVAEPATTRVEKPPISPEPVLRTPTAEEWETGLFAKHIIRAVEPKKAIEPLGSAMRKRVKRILEPGKSAEVNAVKDIVRFAVEIPEFISSVGTGLLDAVATADTFKELMDSMVSPIGKAGGEMAEGIRKWFELVAYQVSPFEGKGGYEEYERKLEEFNKTPLSPAISLYVLKGVAKQISGIPKTKRIVEVTDYMKAQVSRLKETPRAVSEAPPPIGEPIKPTKKVPGKAEMELAKRLREEGVTEKPAEVKFYTGLPIPEIVEYSKIAIKEVTRLTDEFIQKTRAKPEIRAGVKEAKTAMIEHDRMIRGGEWIHKSMKKAFEEATPDKGKQLTIIHAVQQKRNPKYYNQLTPQEKGVVEWMEIELSKLEAFNKEHKITDIKQMPEGVRYVPGSWTNPQTGKPYPIMYGKFSKGLPQAKQKVFSTYEEGMGTGAEMATTNLGDIIGGAWESLTRAQQSREMFKTLHSVGAEKGVEIVLQKGKQPKPIRMIEGWRLLEKQGLTEDYVRYSHYSLDKAITFKDVKGNMVRMQGAVGIRKELFPFVKAYVESPQYGALAGINFASKNLKLGLSLFHPMQLAMQELANWRVPVVNIPKGLRRIKDMDATTKILHQEGLDLWKGYEDVGYRNKFFEGTTKMGRAGNIVTYPITKIRDFIFDIVQPGMKVSFAYDQYTKLLPEYLKKGLTKEKCARDVVTAADGHFSHTHYKRTLLESSQWMVKLYYTPGAKKFWQGALLSPEWQRAHLVVAKNVTKSFFPDRLIKKLRMQEMGPIKAEYRKYALGAVMIVGAVDMYNMLMTQRMDGKAKHIWQNPPGRGFSVRAPWDEPSYTMVDKNGKERTIKGGPAYFRPLKSLYEVAEWGADPIQKLSYKLSPAVAGIGRQLFPSRYQKQYKGFFDIPKRSLDFILDVGTPISAGRTTMVLKGKREWYATALPFVGFPTAKLNVKDTKDLYYDNMIWAEYEHGFMSAEWKKIRDELEAYGIKYKHKEYLEYKTGIAP